MTPDIADAQPLGPAISPSTSTTAGLTTKVVKGSLWTLIGQVLPMMAAFVATPITIRLLGSEGYGVLILVGLVPMYFSFADLGMGVASTRFGSVAYGEGSKRQESQVVWTAASIALSTSLLVAVPIIVFADSITAALNVPQHLHSEGTISLRLAAAAFIFSLLGSVFNSPQLARLRMDLNSAISGGSRVAMALAVPAIIYLGGGIVGATAAGLVIAVLTLAAHIAISGWLLKELFHPGINKTLAGPMLKFGIGLFFSGVAGAILINFEKILLPKIVSVEALAYYSVAFTVANMTTMFGIAMVQSLVPAFSQLAAPGRKAEFDSLFSRSVRMNLMVLPPAIMALFIIAEPFFSVWAGEDFGQESTVPFYILLAGLFVSLLAYVPYSVLNAIGRSDVLAKLYWLELVVFVAVTYALISNFGIIGAAASWSLRMIVDGIVIVWLAKRYAEISFEFLKHFYILVAGMLLLSPPMILTVIYSDPPAWLAFPVIICFALYFIAAWKYFVQGDERLWIRSRVRSLLQRAA